MRLGIGHPGAKEKVIGHVLGDFAKTDHDWLYPLLAAIADQAPLLAKSNDAEFMNKVALATGNTKQTPYKKETKPTKPKGQSHIHQARKPQKTLETPKSGPMAEMLKKLFGDKD